MTHRERVAAALRREEPDRCPMQISFTPEFANRLRAEVSIKGQRIHNPHGGGNTYELERDIGEDMLLTSVGWADSYYQADGTYTDKWGVTWRSQEYETPFRTGRYTEMIGHPLADRSTLARYVPPDPNRPSLYEEADRAIHDYKNECWVVGVTVTTIFELRGPCGAMRS